LLDTDGYPVIDGYEEYCIAGGQTSDFKATSIEFYGVKSQT